MLGGNPRRDSAELLVFSNCWRTKPHTLRLQLEAPFKMELLMNLLCAPGPQNLCRQAVSQRALRGRWLLDHFKAPLSALANDSTLVGNARI